jgi:glycosyltransferase involved in cell wall biosynthesis
LHRLEEAAVKISVALLTLNEVEGLRSLFDRIPFDAVDEVFGVDGGSRDGTCEFLESKQIPVITQTVRGRGEAFRLAVRHARGDIVIFFSPDGNEDPTDIRRFRAYFEQGYDLVIASRMMRGARNEEDDRIVRPRQWANKGFTLAANLIWNTRACVSGRGYITDTINGYRAIRRDAFDALDLRVRDFTIEFQMTIRSLKRGFRIAEFATIEGERIGGVSKVRSMEAGIRFLKTLCYEIVTPAPRRPSSERLGSH